MSSFDRIWEGFRSNFHLNILSLNLVKHKPNLVKIFYEYFPYLKFRKIFIQKSELVKFIPYCTLYQNDADIIILTQEKTRNFIVNKTEWTTPIVNCELKSYKWTTMHNNIQTLHKPNTNLTKNSSLLSFFKSSFPFLFSFLNKTFAFLSYNPFLPYIIR